MADEGARTDENDPNISENPEPTNAHNNGDASVDSPSAIPDSDLNEGALPPELPETAGGEPLDTEEPPSAPEGAPEDGSPVPLAEEQRGEGTSPDGNEPMVDKGLSDGDAKTQEEETSAKEEPPPGEEHSQAEEQQKVLKEEESPVQEEQIKDSSTPASGDAKRTPPVSAGSKSLAPSSKDVSRMTSSYSAAGDSAKRGGAPRHTSVASAGVIARSYEDQIRTGKLNILTSVMLDKDGIPKLVHPGSVPIMNTVTISLAGKRPMSSEKCRRSKSHNCFEGPALRRGKTSTKPKTQGQYPELMKLSKKMNEFVAASMIEKLRLKGLAAPRVVYRGRKLPYSIMSEMILKPTKKKVTDRYYFGYAPPPNRPRYDKAFKQYLQQFSDRHKPPDDELSFSHALEIVRLLSQKSDGSSPLPLTLAEVIRTQEEPGFGTAQLRRPRSAVF